MNENFKPLLIGRDEKKIHQQKKDWEALISSINHLTAKWRGYFSDRITSYNVCYTKLLRP